jgi:hypothetical protein
MAATGKGTLLAREPDENQARASRAVGGSMPADGRDMGATTATSGTARAGGAWDAQEEARPGQTRAQRATLLKQAKEEAAKLAELMIELSESGVPAHPDEAGLEEQLKVATAVLQETGPRRQLAPVPENVERTVAVGVLRAEKSGAESRWQCKVMTCAESYHPLIACLRFLLMSPEERMDLVATAGLCRGCLTPGHGAAVRACPFRRELKGLCAKPKCRQTHHQLLHLEGKTGSPLCQQSGRNTVALNQHRAQVVAAAAHLTDQQPVQLVTQRIRTAAGEPCVTFWDTGSQVTLMTHGATKSMGLKPIPGPPLNLMGVGNGQRTRSTVR